MENSKKTNTLWMVQTAILSAIVLLMAFTPLGFLRAGPIEITFLTIPVVVAAVLVGPASGAVVGLVFGVSSFATAFSSPFGMALLAISPFYTFILTIVPRILVGWLTGLIFRALYRPEREKNMAYTVAATIASLSGALLNTVLFVGSLFLLFGNSEYLRSFGETTLDILAVLITVNAAVEAVATMVLGASVTKGLHVATQKIAATRSGN